jgi:hypothetical protein
MQEAMALLFSLSGYRDSGCVCRGCLGEWAEEIGVNPKALEVGMLKLMMRGFVQIAFSSAESVN